MQQDPIPTPTTAPAPAQTSSSSSAAAVSSTNNLTTSSPTPQPRSKQQQQPAPPQPQHDIDMTQVEKNPSDPNLKSPPLQHHDPAEGAEVERDPPLTLTQFEMQEEAKMQYPAGAAAEGVQKDGPWDQEYMHDEEAYAGEGQGGYDDPNIPASQYPQEQPYYDEPAPHDPRAQAQYYDHMDPHADQHGRYHHDQHHHSDGRSPTPQDGPGAVTVFHHHERQRARGGHRAQGQFDDDGYHINPHAMYGAPGQRQGQGQGQGRGSKLAAQMSVRMPDQVEEPPSREGSYQYQGDYPHPHPYPAHPAQNQHKNPKQSKVHNQFVPPGQKSSPHGQAHGHAHGHGPPTPGRRNGRDAEHVGVEDIGGRHVLVKRAGSGSKRGFWNMHEGAGDEEGEGGEGEEGREAEEEVTVHEEEFDPTAPIVKFDTGKMLIQKWEGIQADTVPFLQDYIEKKLNATSAEILHVVRLFHQLHEEARADFEDGVRKIEAEEKKQEDARKVIVDFADQMKAVAAQLSGFGGMITAATGPAPELGQAGGVAAAGVAV